LVCLVGVWTTTWVDRGLPQMEPCRVRELPEQTYRCWAGSRSFRGPQAPRPSWHPPMENSTRRHDGRVLGSRLGLPPHPIVPRRSRGQGRARDTLAAEDGGLRSLTAAQRRGGRGADNLAHGHRTDGALTLQKKCRGLVPMLRERSSSVMWSRAKC